MKIIQQSEYPTINSQRKSLYASKDIQVGEKITSKNLTVKGPGGGILPKYIDIVINRKTKKKILEDHPITWEDILILKVMYKRTVPLGNIHQKTIDFLPTENAKDPILNIETNLKKHQLLKKYKIIQFI